MPLLGVPRASPCALEDPKDPERDLLLPAVRGTLNVLKRPEPPGLAAKWYPVSKTMAEKVSWEYAEKHGLDIVAINPSTCLGPLLQPGLNASSAVLQQLLQGSKDNFEYYWLGSVHVRDVAHAQVLLPRLHIEREVPFVHGIYQFKDFAETVARLFPGYNVHRFTEETQPGLVACKDASKRLIELGLAFTPIEEAIKESEASMKSKGFLG
ncbi:hypothetical protein HPP92_004084 [Vanilla planifolia]|uniref:NAD-dependent epimerase/dehydratase domain-containing protein n=1 Tax=Vanilla planifolia TaxID=51239 RepID=A0A835SGU9_VANPL|nr:hypothetical protein HPP92_004509 [Vanilla planifolia]KAG0504012.1 hypothetical protein HPP92_004084 [Vanilla planifolia]